MKLFPIEGFLTFEQPVVAMATGGGLWCGQMHESCFSNTYYETGRLSELKLANL